MEKQIQKNLAPSITKLCPALVLQQLLILDSSVICESSTFLLPGSVVFIPVFNFDHTLLYV